MGEMTHGVSAQQKGPFKWPQEFIAQTKSINIPCEYILLRVYKLCEQKYGKYFKSNSWYIYQKGWFDANTAVSGGLRRGVISPIFRQE